MSSRTRARLALPRSRQTLLDSALSPFLYLQATVAGFEYPRSDRAPQAHFVGAVPPEAPADFVAPGWWGELRRKPVVLVTQGTVATDLRVLMRPALQRAS